MGSVKCKTCGKGESIAFCAETGVPICANCAVACDACGAPLSRERAQMMSTGRKLCSKCMAERNAKRRAKKEEMKREAAGKRDAAPLPAAPAVAGTSFEDLLRGDPTLSQAFKGIVREEAPRAAAPAPVEPPKPAGTSFEDLMASDAKPAEPPKKGSKAVARTFTEPGLEGEPGAKTFGLEGQAQEGSKRLTLGPIDDNRPILTGSGHQAPSRKAYIAAFCLFGLAGAIFWTVARIREILVPWQNTAPEFAANQRPVAGDTNALRNASNISQFDLFSQAPIFFIAWFFVLLYVGGAILITWSVGRSLTSSYFAKRRLKKAEEYAKKHGYSYPG